MNRLARITAAGYLDGLDGADSARVRALRDECRAEERRLSYVRRMVQGHLDLAADELERRGTATAPAEVLVTRVSRTLTGAPQGTVSLRAVGLYDPGDEGDELDDVPTARLSELDDDALAEHADRLRRRERALSELRAVLLGRLDHLQATLVQRYRDGRADIDEIPRMADGP